MRGLLLRHDPSIWVVLISLSLPQPGNGLVNNLLSFFLRFFISVTFRKIDTDEFTYHRSVQDGKNPISTFIQIITHLVNNRCDMYIYIYIYIYTYIYIYRFMPRIGPLIASQMHDMDFYKDVKIIKCLQRKS